MARKLLSATLLATALGIVACGVTASQDADVPRVEPGSKRLPARVRRLSNIEYERTLSDVLRMPVDIARRLPPDVRQSGYTRNAEQTLPAAVGTRISALAEEWAARAVAENLDRLAPCHGEAGTRCRDSFVHEIARRAWRRPPSDEEEAELRALFDAGKTAATDFEGGARLVLGALLQSPSLLYIGEGRAQEPPGVVPPSSPRATASANTRGTAASQSTVIKLGPYETASALAYMLRGGPPDEELFNAAARGELATATGRERQARRILGRSDTRYHFRQFVLEWLEVDQLDKTAKDEQLFPGYENNKPEMLRETTAFVDEVMVHQGASIRALLTAGFSSVTPHMARFYGLGAYGARVRSAAQGRLGLLQQASFLSAHAHPDSTSPVKRGDFVLRKVLCVDMPRPSELDIEVVIPPANPEHTTRERFSRHTTNPSCQTCHKSIDALGYTLESFDAQGASRTQDNGKPIDTRVEFRLGSQRQVFQDSAELARWLAEQPQTQECFARQAFRYFSAQADPGVEASFLNLMRQLPRERQGHLIEALVAFVRSDLFVERRLDVLPVAEVSNSASLDGTQPPKTASRHTLATAANPAEQPKRMRQR